MNPLLSLVFLILMVMTATAIILNLGQPIIDRATNAEKFREAENILRFIDNSIKDVAEEGTGSKRMINFYSPAIFQTMPEENAIEMKADYTAIEYFSRKLVGNLIYISGNDVSCSSGSNLVMENSYLKIELQSVKPNTYIETKNNIISIKEKTYDTEVMPSNSEIIVNDDTSTASGMGYSRLISEGNNLPECQAHFHINSTVSYDVYYTLYAGADFLVIDIKNIS